jgi:hypothetical protein
VGTVRLQLTPGHRRLLRAGLVAALAVAAWQAAYRVLATGPQCAAAQGSPFGCLGSALLVVAVGAPVVLVAFAWALHGRGAAVAWLGAVVLAAVLLLVGAMIRSTDVLDGAAALLVFWPVVAGVVAAIYAGATASARPPR